MGHFWGRKLGQNFTVFYMQKFSPQNLGRGILWCSKSEQSANVFSTKIVFFTNSWKFPPPLYGSLIPRLSWLRSGEPGNETSYHHRWPACRLLGASYIPVTDNEAARHVQKKKKRLVWEQDHGLTWTGLCWGLRWSRWWLFCTWSPVLRTLPRTLQLQWRQGPPARGHLPAASVCTRMRENEERKNEEGSFLNVTNILGIKVSRLV